MADEIYIRDYRRKVEVGAFREERDVMQELAFDIHAELTQNFSAKSDHVDDILSYDLLIEAVDNALAGKRYNLLEKLGEDIAGQLLAHPQIQNIRIDIRKLGRIKGALGISMMRSRDDVSPFQSKAKGAPSLIILSDEAQFSRAQLQKLGAADKSAIIALTDKNTRKFITEYQARAHCLGLDARAWQLAEKLELPVIDTKTEADALIARQENFIRALGAQPFDSQPPLQDFAAQELIKWHINIINADELYVDNLALAKGIKLNAQAING